MSKTLPPLPALPPAEVQEWSESWITLRGEGWTRETVEKYASDYALAAIAAQCVPDCKVVDVGFRWDADRQEHVPSIKVEFAPVKANSQNDAKGWKDRDALAAMLAAAPPAPQASLEQQEPMFWVRLCSNGMYEGPLHDKQLEDVRRHSGAWTPLYTNPAPQAKPLTPAQRRELIDRAGDITDGLNQDDFADEIINQVIAAIKTGASNG